MKIKQQKANGPVNSKEFHKKVKRGKEPLKKIEKNARVRKSRRSELREYVAPKGDI